MLKSIQGWRVYLKPLLALLFLVAGFLQILLFVTDAQQIWTAGLVLLGGTVVARTIRDAARGHFATDMVASLAIITAVLLAQPLAGLVVVLMQTGGEALERYAEGRASRAVRELEAAAPSIAHRFQGDELSDIPVDDIAVGDRLLVRPGEMVPCDATVSGGESEVVTAHLTGEPLPRRAVPGVSLMSGALNGDGALEIRAEALAAQSQYARIVQLVRSAQASKSPLQRLADKYAIWFTPITLAVCALAYGVSGDPLRILAVLVVATPCPLILATPVAVIGGINRAARKSIIVRNGTALEQIGQCTTAIFDKTGTLTVGRPTVSEVELYPAADEFNVLQMAASVELTSSHALARSLVAEAQLRGVKPQPVTRITEYSGRGISGIVNGQTVVVGGLSLLKELYPAMVTAIITDSGVDPSVTAFVAVNGELRARIGYADSVRETARPLLKRLRTMGFTRILLLSGDSRRNTAHVAELLGVDEFRGDLLPGDKVDVVKAEMSGGTRVLMVGDGTNDARGNDATNTGLRLGAGGGGITTESAGVVILVDDVERVAAAVQIGRDTIVIARQSIRVGLGLSAVAMVLAAFGFIQPTVGALIQEVIDVAVILNALRASVSA